jgi:hypothetical protein
MTDGSKSRSKDSGKLRIGDDWNAIRIIALSQSNPLKAIAEFVENSIDARARSITITRGREHGAHYLSVKDDGDGVPRDPDGLPDFKYVATHICDSIKRHLKADGGGSGLQGEFGIGLLSFWTVGERLVMTSTGSDQRSYQMTMSKGDSRYEVSPRRVLFAEKGTELKISPLLEGIRTLSGEKIQWYLASELRDRIRDAGVRVTVIDKLARKQYEVEPRQFEGRLLHQLPPIRTVFGDAYAELYLAEPDENARVALTRAGTRVIEDLSTLSGLERGPWASRYMQGLIDVPFLNLTPGTRSGIIQDERYAAWIAALKPLESHLTRLIEEQQRAEEEQASQQSLRAIQKAFHEAMLALPREEYDWFDVQGSARREAGAAKAAADGVAEGGRAGSCPGRRRRSRERHRSGSSSTMQALCSASWSRPPRVPCRSTRFASFGRCPGTDRAGGWSTICSSRGPSWKARAALRAMPIRKLSTGRPPRRVSRVCGSRRANGV